MRKEEKARRKKKRREEERKIGFTGYRCGPEHLRQTNIDALQWPNILIPAKQTFRLYQLSVPSPRPQNRLCVWAAQGSESRAGPPLLIDRRGAILVSQARKCSAALASCSQYGQRAACVPAHTNYLTLSSLPLFPPLILLLVPHPSSYHTHVFFKFYSVVFSSLF